MKQSSLSSTTTAGHQGYRPYLAKTTEPISIRNNMRRSLGDKYTPALSAGWSCVILELPPTRNTLRKGTFATFASVKHQAAIADLNLIDLSALSTQRCRRRRRVIIDDSINIETKVLARKLDAKVIFHRRWRDARRHRRCACITREAQRLRPIHHVGAGG